MKLILITLIFIQCKSIDTGDTGKSKNIEVDPTQIIILLSEGLLPKEIKTIDSCGIRNFKRISRSENKWMFSVTDGEKKISELLRSLKEEQNILDIFVASEERTPNMQIEIKSGKSKPIKN